MTPQLYHIGRVNPTFTLMPASFLMDDGPYYIMIDKLWAAITSRNGSVPVRNGIYKDYDIPLFNEDVIREALNNAIAPTTFREKLS